MPIVYNGVPGSRQGDLFKGLKLWIAQRVPMRDRLIDLLKGNGGEIVKLEKNADMLIADHLRAGGVSPPVGSYSWKWIDVCVDNGHLADKEDYLCGRRKESSRDAGVLEKTKLGRTAYTPQDDLILTKWVMAEERMGNPINGGVIYKALEKKHPRHTWQSWRDRWVKILSHRPRPKLSEEDLQAEVEAHCVASSEPEEHHTATVPSGARPGAQPTRPVPPLRRAAEPQAGSSTPRRRAPDFAASPSSGRGSGRARAFFTDEEDKLLMAYIKTLSAQGDARLSGNVIYKTFAEKHPAHSWHSWRDRWLRHLSLREAVDDAGPDEASNADPRESPHPIKRQRLNKHIDVSATAGPVSPAAGPSNLQRNQQHRSLQSDCAKPNKEQQEETRARAATLIGSIWKGHAVRRDVKNLEAALIPLQSCMRGFVARMQYAERRALAVHDSGYDLPDIEPEEGGDQFEDAQEVLQDVDMRVFGSRDLNGLSPREQFWADLDDIIQGAAIEVDKSPIIDGREIDLWELYRIATEQHCEAEERDWKLVTQSLGMEPIKSLVRKVQACYLNNLADFEDHFKEFEKLESADEEADGVEEAEEAGRDADAAESFHPTSDAVTAPKQPLAHPSSPEYRSSPPTTALKRSLEQTDLVRSDPTLLSSGLRKRRRVDRDSIIPPTPDDKLGLYGSHDHAAWVLNDSSPLRQQAFINGQDPDMSSQVESNELLDAHTEVVEDTIVLPSLSMLTKHQFVEPETQDWHIEQDHFDTVEEDDPSPSQQLLLESDGIQSPSLALRDQRTTAKEVRQPLTLSLQYEGSGHSTARVLRSHLQPTAVQEPSKIPSRNTVKEKATKRTLPAHYNRTMVVASASGPAALEEPRLSQRPPQLHETSPVLYSNTAPARPTKKRVPTLKLFNPTAIVPAMQSHRNRASASSHHTPTPSGPSSRRNDPTATTLEFDKAYVDDQFQFFQGLGFKERHINEAMKAANMDRRYMVPALASLHRGHGIPRDEAGVWTAQDTEDLRKVKKYERQVEKGKATAGQQENNSMRVTAWELEKKHGKNNMAARWSFMRMLGMTDGA